MHKLTRSSLELAQKGCRIWKRFEFNITESRARQILGLRRLDITVESKGELRDKYYSLAKMYHPDSADSSVKDGSKFSLLTEAYVMLTKETPRPDEDALGYDETMKILWAKMFFGTIEAEITVSESIVDGVLEAATLSRGGLDKGGMWDFVDKFSAMHGSLTHTSNRSSNPDDSRLIEDASCPYDRMKSEDNNSPRPFTRKKK